MNKKHNMPAKTGINLCMRESHAAGIRTLVIGVVLIVLLAGAVAKFGVYDQYARLSAAQAEYNKYHSQTQAFAEALKDYKKVETDYRTHSLEWLDDISVDRIQVLDMVEAELMPIGSIEKIAVVDNTMWVSMVVEGLRDFSVLKSALESHDIVKRVDLNQAGSEMDGITQLGLFIELQQEVAQ